MRINFAAQLCWQPLITHVFIHPLTTVAIFHKTWKPPGRGLRGLNVSLMNNVSTVRSCVSLCASADIRLSHVAAGMRLNQEFVSLSRRAPGGTSCSDWRDASPRCQDAFRGCATRGRAVAAHSATTGRITLMVISWPE